MSLTYRPPASSSSRADPAPEIGLKPPQGAGPSRQSPQKDDRPGWPAVFRRPTYYGRGGRASTSFCRHIRGESMKQDPSRLELASAWAEEKGGAMPPLSVHAMLV